MIRSMRGKMIIAILGAAVLALGGTLAISYSVLRRSSDEASREAQASARGEIEASIRREGLALSQALVQYAADPVVDLDFVQLRDICAQFKQAASVMGVRVYGPTGALLADGTPGPAIRVTQASEALPGAEPTVAPHGDHLTVGRRIQAGSRVLGHVVVDVSLAPAAAAQALLSRRMDAEREEAQTELFTASVVATVVLLLLCAIGALWLGSRLSRPVVALKEAAERVAHGNLDVAVTVKTRDEVGVLGHTFNQMIDELSRARAAQREQARMARELEIAAKIQSSLLPQAPTHPDFEFAGRMKAADEVGGDFYDVLSDPRTGALWLTCGDVASHGIGAGVVMLMTQASFGTVFRAQPKMPGPDVFRCVNRVVRENTAERLKDSKHVTAQLLTYEGNGTFSACGAHEWPIVYRAKSKTTEVIECGGPWLGIVDELPNVPTSRIQLAEGDVLCLYSDGIIQAVNDKDEQFDVARLRKIIENELAGGGSLDRVNDALLEAVASYSTVQDDDRTLLLVRRRKPAGRA